jgi:hypothetical protein
MPLDKRPQLTPENIQLDMYKGLHESTLCVTGARDDWVVEYFVLGAQNPRNGGWCENPMPQNGHIGNVFSHGLTPERETYFRHNYKKQLEHVCNLLNARAP